jgi:hypothetical protein
MTFGVKIHRSLVNGFSSYSMKIVYRKSTKKKLYRLNSFVIGSLET